MFRFVLLLAAALLAASPLTLADLPPGPDPTCARDTAAHHYLPPGAYLVVWGHDGNLLDCDPANTLVADAGVCVLGLRDAPGLCAPYDTGAPQPLRDYDGDLDFALGGAYLFVRTGDGVSEGVEACYGAPSRGHHGTTVYAADALGFGPSFVVTADASWPGPWGEIPDCGDGFVDPCDPHPPAPSTLPYPINVAADTVAYTLYQPFGPSGAACNPNDHARRFPGTPVAPSGGPAGFDAGADGALIVFLAPDLDNARLGQGGHVWTA